jgi:hypothetical protein
MPASMIALPFTAGKVVSGTQRNRATARICLKLAQAA